MHKKKLKDKIDKMFSKPAGTKDVDFLAKPSSSVKSVSIKKKSEKIFTKGESASPERKSTDPIKMAIDRVIEDKPSASEVEPKKFKKQPEMKFDKLSIKEKHKDMISRENVSAKEEEAVIEKDHDFQELLLFRLGKEYYGVHLIDIDAIHSINKITKVPMVPSYIKGIIHLRGKIITLINMEKLLDINTAREEKKSFDRQLIISQNISFQIDQIIDVVKIENSKFEKISSTDEGLKNFFISELINMENKIIGVINIKKLLTSEVITG